MKLINLPPILSFVSVATILLPAVANAATLNLSFTKLSGLTGGTPSATAIYRANLTDLGFDLNSILIKDNSGGLGGSPGAFSGFDLDAIKLSNSLINTAGDISSIAGLNVFDFSSTGTLFTPGSQRLPVAPALFGTTGTEIDNAIATLGSFDANSTTGPTALGFASLGDNGSVGFNLTSAVSTTTPLYLYIGEVGDNGEVAAGQITVSDKPIESVPEPATLLGLAAIGVAMATRRQEQTIPKE